MHQCFSLKEGRVPLRDKQIKLGLRLALGGPKRASEPMGKDGKPSCMRRLRHIQIAYEALLSFRLAYEVPFDVKLETCSVYEYTKQKNSTTYLPAIPSPQVENNQARIIAFCL